MPLQKSFPKFYFGTTQEFIEHLHASPNNFGTSTIYVYQIGRVFTVLALVEDTLVQALHMCSNVKLDGRRKPLPGFRDFNTRRNIFKDQTFGNLIQVLEVNGLSSSSISYLHFIKRVRDGFVHRFFESNAWPGEMKSEMLLTHSRTLAAYEIIFNRASTRIWKILGQEIFSEFVDLGADGFIVTNDIAAAFDGENRNFPMHDTN